MKQQTGILKQWHDERGFGFIDSDIGDVFVHISAIRGDRRPLVGDRVVFIADTDENGRVFASFMRMQALGVDDEGIRIKAPEKNKPRSSQTHTRRPRKTYRRGSTALWQYAFFLIAMVICVQGICLAYDWYGWWWLPVLYAGMSVIGFFQYWLDKYRASHGQSYHRLSERSLHWVEFLGGWMGAFIAQQVFRHKTKKGTYQFTYWLIVLLHTAFWADYYYWNGKTIIWLYSWVVVLFFSLKNMQG